METTNNANMHPALTQPQSRVSAKQCIFEHLLIGKNVAAYLNCLYYAYHSYEQEIQQNKAIAEASKQHQQRELEQERQNSDGLQHQLTEARELLEQAAHDRESLRHQLIEAREIHKKDVTVLNDTAKRISQEAEELIKSSVPESVSNEHDRATLHTGKSLAAILLESSYNSALLKGVEDGHKDPSKQMLFALGQTNIDLQRQVSSLINERDRLIKSMGEINEENATLKKIVEIEEEATPRKKRKGNRGNPKAMNC